MNSTAPNIDSRDQKGIASKVREYLVRFLPGTWSGTEAVSGDTGIESLVQLFSRLIYIVNQRLNKVADKHFLSFLETLGVDPIAPKAARTDLAFETSPKATSSVIVPEGTQVTRSGGGKEPLIFETETSVEVLPFKPTVIYSHDPEDDFYSDCSYVAQDTENASNARLFAGNRLTTHRIYFGHKHLLSYEESVKIKLDVDLKETVTPSLNQWIVKWYYFSEDSEEPVLIENVVNPDDPSDTSVLSLLKSGSIEFPNISGVVSKKIGGYGKTKSNGVWNSVDKENNWIFAELQSSLPFGTLSIPEIARATISASLQSEEKKIERAVLNNHNLDVSRDFYPFDKKPEFNDTVYFFSEFDFSEPGASVTMKVELSKIGAADPVGSEIKLFYEYWDGKDWAPLGTSSSLTGGSGGIYQFEDDSLAFTQATVPGSGETPSIRFICPANKPLKVNGKEGYWIRARLIEGNFGKEAWYEYQNDTYLYHPATYAPPCIASIKTMRFSSYDSNVDVPEAIVTENGYFFQDHTILNNHNNEIPPETIGNYYKPFVYGDEMNPAFYIGFDGEIANHSISMFFSIPGGALNAFQMVDVENPPLLVWETWSSGGWIPISVTDHTEEFTRREAVKLIVSGEAEKRPLFGKMVSWVRVRLAQGQYRIVPEVDRIYMNTVKASNRVTVTDELLGSSTGEANQVFRLPRSPILEGQQIVVTEYNLTIEDEEEIKAEEGDDAVEKILDESGKIVEARVRWHEVNRFDFSDSSSRHYLIDRASGDIRFGDGKRGMIPPRSRNNIRCNFYQYGGGYRGNVEAKTLTKLRNFIPLIKSVTNPMAVEGGVDQEDLDGVRERGPAIIKSRNRAVTISDFENLVTQSTGEIARVRCLPTTDGDFERNPGYVMIIIIPNKDVTVRKPSPSPELIEFIDDYLSSRAATEIANSNYRQINVVGPSFLEIGTDIKVHILSTAEAKDVQNRIRDRLDHFFHALYGGDKGKGWEYGRNVYLSEVYAVIENIEGVDYVESISLNSSRQIKKLFPSTAFFVPATYPAGSTLNVSGFRTITDDQMNTIEVPVEMTMNLVEDIVEDVGISEFIATGFQEDDVVSVFIPGNSTVELFQATIAGLEYTAEGRLLKLTQSIHIKDNYPAGETIITTKAGKIVSTLIDPLSANTDVTELLIAEPKSGDSFEILNKNSSLNRKKGVLSGSEDTTNKVYLDSNYLVYSGTHEILIM